MKSFGRRLTHSQIKGLIIQRDGVKLSLRKPIGIDCQRWKLESKPELINIKWFKPQKTLTCDNREKYRRERNANNFAKIVQIRKIQRMD